VIEELLEGLDGFVQAAKIRTSAGKTNRPVAKFYPLELSTLCEPTTGDNTDTTAAHATATHKDDDQDSNPELVHRRPTRDAAAKARAHIKDWTGMLTVAPEDVND